MAEDRVTLRDVYDAINRVEDNLKKEFNERITKVEKDVEEVKSFQNKLLGVVSALSLFFGSAAAYIWNRIFNNL